MHAHRALASEGFCLVSYSLIGLFNGLFSIQPYPIYPFDAVPRPHRAISAALRCPGVLICEDYRISSAVFDCVRMLYLVIHQQRNIAEMIDGVCSCI